MRETTPGFEEQKIFKPNCMFYRRTDVSYFGLFDLFLLNSEFLRILF